MSSPFRAYRTFTDADGVGWSVEARLLGEGADAMPVGFAFTSECGELRVFAACAPDCLSWEQFCDEEWWEPLTVARPVWDAKASRGRRRYAAAQYSGPRHRYASG